LFHCHADFVPKALVRHCFGKKKTSASRPTVPFRQFVVGEYRSQSLYDRAEIFVKPNKAEWQTPSFPGHDFNKHIRSALKPQDSNPGPQSRESSVLWRMTTFQKMTGGPVGPECFDWMAYGSDHLVEPVF
jgi:hypothetical protein